LQIDKFKNAAHKLETDGDKQRFNETLEAIARSKPSDRPVTRLPKEGV
jgi:hypothetical protein